MSEEKKDYMLIKLTRGLYTKVDPEDFYRLNVHKWYAIPGGKTFYAVRNKRTKTGKRIRIRMHQEIVKPPPGYELDHKDRNGINNRSKNIRVVTHAQNSKNYGSIGGGSNYKGVSWNKQARKWRAQLRINYKQTHLGYFDSEKEAAIAYDDAAFENSGVYAFLNFPERFADKGMDAIL